MRVPEERAHAQDAYRSERDPARSPDSGTSELPRIARKVLAPVHDREALLEGLRAAKSAGFGYARKRLERSRAVPHEPAADYHSGATTSCPAVNEDDPSGVDLRVDRPERHRDLLARRGREVAHRDAQVAGGADVAGVRSQFILLGEVEEQGHAQREQLRNLGLCVGGGPGARVAARDELSRLDPGSWAHTGGVCPRRDRRRALSGRVPPERVGETTPLVAELDAVRRALELPVRANECAEVRRQPSRLALPEHAQVPRSRVQTELGSEAEGAVAQTAQVRVERRHT